MRTLYVLFRLAPFLVSFRRDSRRWIVVGRPARRTAAFHARRADALVRTVAALGPSFVKIAQIFAGRADLLPEPYLGAVSSLADRVPPVPIAGIRAQIIAAYGEPPESLFDEWDSVPVASASLGQVHRARWRGHDVAVKVLRPGAEAMVARDIAAGLRILGIAERFFTNPHLRGLRAILGEFAQRIGDEMDFRQEAAYAEEIRANFAGNPRVAIPLVHRELVRQRVLVLQFMEGRTLAQLAPLVESGHITAGTLAAGVMELYVQMMLVDGLFHADPHPGNLLWRDDGTVILLDFGLVVRVPRETRLTLVRTVFAAIRNDPTRVVDGFYALGVIQPGTPRATVERLVQILLGIAFERTTAQERLELVQRELLAEQVLETLYDFPVVLPADMVYFARTAALIEGIGTRYDARFNAIAVAAPIALRMRRVILRSLGEAIDPATRRPLDIGAVVRSAAGIVERAARELGALALETAAALQGVITPVAGNHAVVPRSPTPATPPTPPPPPVASDAPREPPRPAAPAP